MNQARSIRAFLVTAACATCALLATHAGAFSLKVSPIPIEITGGASSTMAEVGNEGDEPIRVEASVYDWTQTATGEDKTDPSTELLVFPSLLTIPPHTSRRVRIGTQGGYAAGEKTFRVIFGEIPSETSPVDAKQETVKVVAHVSVPIFVTPAGAAPAMKIEGLALSNNHLKFGLHNTGNAHVLVEKLRVDLLGKDGKPLGGTDATGWYVLPGIVRPFDIDLTKKVNCAGAKSLVLTATSTQSGSVTATLDHPACN
jgi:fimbrial chaperone protein